MKKYKFYIILLISTIIIGLIFFYFSDYSRRVKTIYSLMKEKDKEKIINGLVEKVEADTLKDKFKSVLIVFGNRIENDEYSDEHLKELLDKFEKIVDKDKISSNEIEEFAKKVNQDF